MLQLFSLLPTNVYNAFASVAFGTMMPFSTTTAKGPDFTGVVSPVVGILNTIFTAAIPIVGAVGAIYCIILGLKLAKADEQQERDKAKHALKNAIIGFVAIFVLVVVMRLAIPVLSQWMETSAPTK